MQAWKDIENFLAGDRSALQNNSGHHQPLATTGSHHDHCIEYNTSWNNQHFADMAQSAADTNTPTTPVPQNSSLNTTTTIRPGTSDTITHREIGAAKSSSFPMYKPSRHADAAAADSAIRPDSAARNNSDAGKSAGSTSHVHFPAPDEAETSGFPIIIQKYSSADADPGPSRPYSVAGKSAPGTNYGHFPPGLGKIKSSSYPTYNISPSRHAHPNSAAGIGHVHFPGLGEVGGLSTTNWDGSFTPPVSPTGRVMTDPYMHDLIDFGIILQRPTSGAGYSSSGGAWTEQRSGFLPYVAPASLRKYLGLRSAGYSNGGAWTEQRSDTWPYAAPPPLQNYFDYPPTTGSEFSDWKYGMYDVTPPNDDVQRVPLMHPPTAENWTCDCAQCRALSQSLTSSTEEHLNFNPHNSYQQPQQQLGLYSLEPQLMDSSTAHYPDVQYPPLQHQSDPTAYYDPLTPRASSESMLMVNFTLPISPHATDFPTDIISASSYNSPADYSSRLLGAGYDDTRAAALQTGDVWNAGLAVDHTSDISYDPDDTSTWPSCCWQREYAPAEDMLPSIPSLSTTVSATGY